MKILQSPDNIKDSLGKDLVFLAGGISNCPNWQQDVIDMFNEKYEPDEDTILVNPRRVGDLARDSEEAVKQIRWEIGYIAASVHYMFWFPKETVCPITLFELGKIAQMLSHKERDYDGSDYITVGIHPEYSRKLDLEIQLPMIIENIDIVYSLEDLVKVSAEKINLTKK